MTPQGRAIQSTVSKFGDGKTLPFTPCKKGYVPFHKKTGRQLYACQFHNEARRKRMLLDTKGGNRPGEVDLNIFWKSAASS